METQSLDVLAQKAQHLLREQTGRAISLIDPVLMAARDRSLTVRCAVAGLAATRSVVIKWNTSDDARGFTELASLRFLTGLPGAREVAPSLYAGTSDDRILVMEDLGEARSLENLLDHGDVATVRRAVRALAIPMARLVEASSGREESFERLRSALPGAVLGRSREAERWINGFGRIERWADALGIQLPQGFRDAFGQVAGVYAHPGPYLAFSHGDPAPSNNHIVGSQARLMDFEYGAYRHALYDITGWFVLCPLPPEWVADLERSFRGSLRDGPARGLVEDEATWCEAWGIMCAYRALAMMTWFPTDLLEQDRQWVPGWTMRPAIISTVLRLRDATAGISDLQSITEFAARATETLRMRWPELGDGAIPWPALAR